MKCSGCFEHEHFLRSHATTLGIVVGRARVIFKNNFLGGHRDLPVHVCIGDCISGDSLIVVIPDCSLSLSHYSLPPILVGVGDCLGRENSTGLVLQRRYRSVVSC